MATFCDRLPPATKKFSELQIISGSELLTTDTIPVLTFTTASGYKNKRINYSDFITSSAKFIGGLTTASYAVTASYALNAENAGTFNVEDLWYYS